MHFLRYYLLLFFVLVQSISAFAQDDYALPREKKEEPNIPKHDSILTVAEDSLTDSVITVIVETMPVYPGGEEGRLNFLKQNIRYPREAMDRNKQGTVYISFVITAECKTDSVHVVKGVHPLLDAEALRVASLFRFEKPGMQNGKPVNVKFYCPFTFKLN